jgi:ribose transport system permease protein
MRNLLLRVFDPADRWPVVALVGLCLVYFGLRRGFSAFDLRTLCVSVLPLALIVLGQFFVVMVRGIDLSLGPIASVSGAATALLITDRPILALALALGTGCIGGALNGFLVAGLQLPPIIVTLATMLIWQGIALEALPNPGGSVPRALRTFFSGGDIVPPSSLILLVVVTIFGLWLMTTEFGLHLRAVGGDPQAAAMSGVRVKQVKLGAYGLAGVLAALGGIYLAIATSSGSPTIGDSYILTSVAAVVLGGVPLMGGRGGVVGVMMGSLILVIVGKLLYLGHVPSFYQSIIEGIILLSVVGLSSFRERRWS